MEQDSRARFAEITTLIYHNMRDLLWRDIMAQLINEVSLFDFDLDRGYTIRNYAENWAIIPRCIIDNKIYGYYIRSGNIHYNPL